LRKSFGNKKNLKAIITHYKMMIKKIICSDYFFNIRIAKRDTELYSKDSQKGLLFIST
jgi:hypothetical protein